VSGFGDGEEFLDADASKAHTIRPWLDRHHVSGAKNIGRTRVHPRGLVNQQPDAVTHSMGEFVLESGSSQNRATGRVDFAAGDTRPHCRNTCLACAAHDVVPRTHAVGPGAIDHERARHVGVVTVDEGSEIHDHRITRAELAIGRMMVRKCGVGPRRHDRGKTHVVCTEASHCGVEFVAKCTLGCPGSDEMRDARQCFVGDLRSTANALEFRGALGTTEVRQHRRHVNEGFPPQPTARRNQCFVFGDADATRFEAPEFTGYEDFGNGVAHRGLRSTLDDAHVRIRDFRLERGLFAVASVRHEHDRFALVGRSDDDGRTARESRQPTDVLVRGHEDSVELPSGFDARQGRNQTPRVRRIIEWFQCVGVDHSNSYPK
jgi:hypothetical protein